MCVHILVIYFECECMGVEQLQFKYCANANKTIWQRPINIPLFHYEITEGNKFTNGPSQKPQQVILGSRCAKHDVFQNPHSCTSLAGCLSGCLVGWWLGWTLWLLVSGQARWAAVLLGWLGLLDWLGRLGLLG